MASSNKPSTAKPSDKNKTKSKTSTKHAPASKENTRPQERPVDTNRRTTTSAASALADDTNQCDSGRARKPSQKVVLLAAQKRDNEAKKKEEAARKAQRAQRDKPDTDDEEDDNPASKDDGDSQAAQSGDEDNEEEHDGMFTSRIVATKLSKSKTVQQLPLKLSNSRIPPTHKPRNRNIVPDEEDDEEADTNLGNIVYDERSDIDMHQDSPPPANNLKRRAPSIDSLRDTQMQKTTGQRPKAADYEDDQRDCIALAVGEYRALISTKGPFPDRSRATEYAKLAWENACTELDYSVTLTTRIAGLITKRASQMRGELKTKAKPIVEMFYGFESGQGRKVVKKNRTIAETLKDDHGYYYKDASEKKGLFKNKLIQKIINVVWFTNRQDEGLVYEDYFQPISPITIALVLTAIECCIDEWLSDQRVDISFTAAAYSSVYNDNLNALHDFSKNTEACGLWNNLLEKLYNRARFHAGAQPISQVLKRPLSISAIEAAVKEYEEDEETETDGERGDSD